MQVVHAEDSFDRRLKAAVHQGTDCGRVGLKGDSLASLEQLAYPLVAVIRGRAECATIELAEELHERLAGFLTHYEHVLTEHGIQLPFIRRVETE